MKKMKRFLSMLLCMMMLLSLLPAGASARGTIKLSASPTDGGSVQLLTPNNNGYVNSNRATIQATPNSGYRFQYWENQNGTQINKATTEVGINYNQTFTYTAYFVKTFQVTTSVNIEGAGSVSGNKGTYDNNESATLTATPATGYRFVNWTENGNIVKNAGATYTFTVSKDRNLVANFELEQYTVTAKPYKEVCGTAGVVNPSESGKYTYNSQVTVEAEAKTGHTFAHWTKGADKVSEANPYTFTVTGDAELVAHFSTNQYTVKFHRNDGSNIVHATKTVSHGDPVAAPTEQPEMAFHAFRGWYAQGATEAYDFTQAVTGPLDLYAKWVEVHDVNFYYDDVAPHVPYHSVKVDDNTRVEKPADPSKEGGYRFDRWTVQNNSGGWNTFGFGEDGKSTVTISDSLNLVAAWVKTWNVTATAEHGTVEGAGTYDQGTDVELTATPAEGYHFVKWVDGETEVTSNTYVISDIDADHNVTAVFAKNTYGVTVEVTPAEGGSTSGAGTYEHGDRVTLTATVNDGYIFKNWTEGETVVTSNPYVIESVTANHNLTANFAKLHNVKFHKNDGTDKVDTEQVENGNPVEEPAAPERNGYRFVGWYEKDATVAYDFEKAVKGDLELYAKWVKTYKVTFHRNEGTFTNPSQKDNMTVDAGSVLAEPEITKTGYHGYSMHQYELLGWYTDDDFKTEYDFSKEVNGDIHLYAKWVRLHEVRFYENKRSETPLKTILVPEGATVASALTTEADKPYLRAEWDYDTIRFGPNGEDTKLKDLVIGEYCYNLYGTPIYEITFNGNDATSGSMNPMPVEHGDSADLPANTFKKTGYTFNGWKDAAGKDYANEAENIAVNADIALTAQWVPNTYHIIFNGNGTDSVAMEAIEARYDVAVDLPANTFEKTGYDFDGWNTKADGSGTSYANEAEVKNLTTEATDVTLYAQWTPTKYTITYNGMEGATATPANPTEYTIESAAITLNAPTKPGFRFDGWTDVQGAKVEGVAIPANSTGDKTFTATWVAQFTVTFDRNGHGTAPEAVTVDTGVAVAAPDAPSATGYTFGGWYTEAACTTAYDFATAVTADVTLYAKWTPITYKVIFDPNGGELRTKSAGYVVQDFTYDAEQALQKNAYVLSGHSFKGWNTRKNGDGTSYEDEAAVKNLASNQGAEVTLYAQWEKNAPVVNPVTKYKVTYDANGGRGTMGADTVEAGGEYTLLANKFTAPSGKVFKCWKINNKEYKPGEVITVDFDITVKAVWKDQSTDLDYVPATGDNFSGFLWALLMLSGAVALVEVAVLRRKRR